MMVSQPSFSLLLSGMDEEDKKGRKGREERGGTHREPWPILNPQGPGWGHVIPKSGQVSEDWSLALQTQPRADSTELGFPSTESLF